MPMKTTLLSRSPRARSSEEKRAACSKISASLRSRRKPICPVAQKVQPIAQPTCDEMHAVRRRSSYGISTDSMSDPSWQRQRRFCVPSLDCCSNSTPSSPSVACSRNLARSAFGSVCIASMSAAGVSP